MFSFNRLGGLLLPAVFAVSLAAPPAWAHGYKAGSLEIGHPWARETPPGASMGAGYLAVTNAGAVDDRLLAVEVPSAGRVEIHQSTTEDGVARMRPVPDGIVLPAGRETVLKPGGYHLMIMGLKTGLAKGARVPATLVFEKAGRLDVDLAVEPMGFGGGDDHAHH